MTIISKTLAGTHDLLAPAAAFPERYPCLLQSVQRGRPQSRYDILFAFPQARLTLQADGHVRDTLGNLIEGDFLQALDAAWTSERTDTQAIDTHDDEVLPFHGGWAIFLAYELAAQIEPTLALRPAEGLPIALALRCPAAVIIDHACDRTIVLAESAHVDLLEVMEQDLRAATTVPMAPAATTLVEDDPRLFLDGIARIDEHLRAGDIFQANLSRAWHAHYAKAPAPAALYGALRTANPAPFAGLLQQPGWALISSSPERLIEVRGGVAQTRPIAGTRARRTDEDDAAHIRELRAHPKERAEHIMLIDLERNDLGRVCVPGTVEVDQLMTVESYAHVHHIVSNVRGRLRPRVTPGEVIAATFPGGTITGCPKLRCMQIIAALENAPRGAYTGALGYLDRNGDLDLSILIRTLTQQGDTVSLRAGAGIVADSIATAELEETRAKAHGLLRALGMIGA